MVSIRPYKTEDEVIIQSWIKVRGIVDDWTGSRPKLGLVAEQDGVTIAAGFLRRLEGNMLLIDGLITNSEIAAPLRNEALDAMTLAMYKLAKTKRILGIIGWSADSNTLNRAIKHGFHTTADTIIAVKIG